MHKKAYDTHNESRFAYWPGSDPELNVESNCEQMTLSAHIGDRLAENVYLELHQ